MKKLVSLLALLVLITLSGCAPDINLLTQTNVALSSSEGKIFCAGTIISKLSDRLHVLTAAHCYGPVESGSIDKIYILTEAYRPVPAEVIKFDRELDLMLLLTERLPHNIINNIPAAYIPRSQPTVGDDLVVVGSPNRIDDSFSWGKLGNAAFIHNMAGLNVNYDLPIMVWYGNSGGGVYNKLGQLVGVVVELHGIRGAAVALPFVREFLGLEWSPR